jgi:hypothetical protein
MEYDREHFRIRLERNYEALGGAAGTIFIVLARHI